MSPSATELSEHLEKLSNCEVQMAEAEKQCEIFHAKTTQGIFSKRRAITQNIPQFWYIVLAQCDDFAEYVRPEDLKYMELISDIYVHRDVVDSDDVDNYRDFSITFQFSGSEGDALVPQQTVTKKFTFSKKDGQELMVSQPVTVEWPQELQDISPAKIRSEKLGEYTPEQRKKYRQGMRSFFAWFEWTGKKPGKEFRGGEDLAQLITDEIFPGAVNLYVEAMNSEQDSDVDSSEGEELDVSDDDDDDDEPEQKKQKV
ncbi:hypothetical protein METBIDRAFT_78120 [Metschnikowia bicuspidata var. bicuspidata NRRL YB-4993]|uniref:Uncharacterized protein n=1 Tax=Metschnikowia bicuspidata var. bicuspidata NRRL YB-4993 TaxID=869754 RepID=A0A1A0HA68_9ASCO|nr:hypothetical protein METBIDRAFT_78120 [Metschnikowia bicuspidata var. bicuspidata NRRL YB-4993]OBA21024.1 hypothetical protein METBIDRAFT_78120 [Metschnikowia bicuspidata var. bicuspidata NRRL YB-4993]